MPPARKPLPALGRTLIGERRRDAVIDVKSIC